MNYEMLREIIGVRSKSFLFLAFLGILNLALFLYLSHWQRPELEKAQTEWFAKRKAIASGQSTGTAQGYQNGMRDLALFQKRVLPKKEFPAFLSEIFEAAKNNSLSLKGINYKPAMIKDEGMLSYGISFTVSGKYASVKSFIADMARLHEMVTLESLSLNSKSQTEESVELKVDMTVYLKMEGP